MDRASFQLFCLLGITSMVILQVIDLIVESHSLWLFLQEWGPIDLLWLGLAAIALFSPHQVSSP